MKLKLDLHTHPYEATGIREPDVGLATEIVTAIKACRLDGIAVTEHEDSEFGYKLKYLVERHFPDQVVIIPGREVVVSELGFAEVVELYLPSGVVFRFLAHPSYPYPDQFAAGLSSLHGIELRNGLHDRQLDCEKIRAMAGEYGLLLLENSDAHRLRDIGLFYNEVDLDELASRAVAGR
ncbi:MAG: PHP domain-containing protein [Chloroflexota bacterium]